MKNHFLTIQNSILLITIISVFFSSSINSQIITDGLIAYYPLYENTTDLSGNGYHGTPLPETTFDHGLFVENNINQGVSIPYQTLNNLGDFSIAMDIKFHSYNNHNNIINASTTTVENSFLFQWRPLAAGVFAISFNGTHYPFTNAAPQFEEWHQIIIQREGSSFSLFINGTASGNLNIGSSQLSISEGGLFIGQDQDCLGGCFDPNQTAGACIKNIYLFNRPLNDAEISSFPSPDPSISFSLGNDTTICSGASIMINGLPGAENLWQDGSIGDTYWVDQPGTYSLIATTPCNTISDEIIVNTEPNIDLTINDTFICNNIPIVFDFSFLNNINLLWPDGTTSSQYTVSESGNYNLTASNNCEEITYPFSVSDCEACNLYIPNVFSPNNDGLNETFEIFSNCEITQFKIEIFNRWGGLVYTSSDPNKGWNGKLNNRLLNSGVYVWLIDLTVLENGILRVNKKLSGSVTLLGGIERP